MPKKSPKKVSSSNRRLVIRVELEGTEPAIWRRLELAPELRLDQVHDVLQAAFGWENVHLHEFESRTPIDPADQSSDAGKPAHPPGSFAEFLAASGKEVPPPTHITRRFGMQMEEGYLGSEESGEPETKTTIGQLYLNPDGELYYFYDFGDGWELSLTLEEMIDVKPGSALVRCVAGELASPPEDSGGIWTYGWVIGASMNPEDPDHEEALDRLEWMADVSGKDEWDPMEFDREEIDAAVRAAV